MKKLLIILIASFTCTGLHSQAKEYTFNNVIITEFDKGQPTGKKTEEVRKVTCVISKEIVQVNDLNESGGVLQFSIDKTETNMAGSTIYTCMLKGEEYSISLTPDNFAMIIFGNSGVVLLQRSKEEALEKENENKNCP